LDWSERGPHTSGLLGEAILDAFESSRWVVRQLDGQELLLTARGSKALSDHFGLNLLQERMESGRRRLSSLAPEVAHSVRPREIN